MIWGGSVPFKLFSILVNCFNDQGKQDVEALRMWGRGTFKSLTSGETRCEESSHPLANLSERQAAVNKLPSDMQLNDSKCICISNRECRKEMRSINSRLGSRAAEMRMMDYILICFYPR